jgi:hypothetical protein
MCPNANVGFTYYFSNKGKKAVIFVDIKPPCEKILHTL